MNVQALKQTLEKQLREELDIEDRSLELIEVQTKAIRDNQPDALDDATKRLEALMAGGTRRITRRKALFDLLAKHWGVDHKSISIGSILDRIDASKGPLGKLRSTLQVRLKEVGRASRKLNALITMHRGIIRDVLHSSLAIDASPASPIESGALINAEA